ncbi:hypothetical protein B296_00021181 [Ensete ventricosum]|uniref:DUF3700 domain-containing protein n=1 Tax=Ensete ventricosum TaxID=4639 RepID=A0A427A5B3_ENSVE|nr:hypothetical protein B296_00021181 [Ensete ventricosum]
MLAVFDRKVAKSPEGLRSPGAEGGDGGRSLLDHFLAARAGAVVINVGSSGGLAYTSKKQTPLLPSFEHPTNELKPMPRVDSQGQVCGATYKVDYMAKKDTGMPRVGSSANWSSQF